MSFYLAENGRLFVTRSADKLAPLTPQLIVTINAAADAQEVVHATDFAQVVRRAGLPVSPVLPPPPMEHTPESSNPMEIVGNDAAAAAQAILDALQASAVDTEEEVSQAPQRARRGAPRVDYTAMIAADDEVLAALRNDEEALHAGLHGEAEDRPFSDSHAQLQGYNSGYFFSPYPTAVRA